MVQNWKPFQILVNSMSTNFYLGMQTFVAGSNIYPVKNIHRILPHIESKQSKWLKLHDLISPLKIKYLHGQIHLKIPSSGPFYQSSVNNRNCIADG